MKRFVIVFILCLISIISFSSCSTKENISTTYVSVNENGNITRYEYETTVDSLIYKAAKMKHKDEVFTLYKLTYSPNLYNDYIDEWDYLIKDVIELPELAEAELVKYNFHITKVSY